MEAEPIAAVATTVVAAAPVARVGPVPVVAAAPVAAAPVAAAIVPAEARIAVAAATVVAVPVVVVAAPRATTRGGGSNRPPEDLQLLSPSGSPCVRRIPGAGAATHGSTRSPRPAKAAARHVVAPVVAPVVVAPPSRVDGFLAHGGGREVLPFVPEQKPRVNPGPAGVLGEGRHIDLVLVCVCL